MTNKTTTWNQPVPTANIAVSKSRVKLYTNKGELPTYYLQKGQEFQIELFNPTTDTILAKITLNNKIISQGGLVLRPGQRVFLERFLDVEKKFLFDTYEVSNTAEVKAAIKNNGDFKVQFYRESRKNPILLMGQGSVTLGGSFRPWAGNDYQDIRGYVNNSTAGGYVTNTVTSTNSAPYTLTSSVANNAFYNSSPTMDGTLSLEGFNVTNTPINNQTEKISKGILRGIQKKSKTIETGTVEQGSKSDQKFNTIDKDFDSYAFHTIECKILPISQKLVSSEDLNLKKYCTNCGAKLGKTDKFCASCGTKA